MADKHDKLAILELQTKKYINESLEPMGGEWQEQMHVDKSNLSNRIDNLQNSLVQYEKKLDILQRDATELTAAYEKQSASIESDLDSKAVFQSILDHKLNQEDLTTVLIYIKKLFTKIEHGTHTQLEELAGLDASDEPVMNILQIHAQRRINPDIAFCYNKVCNKMEIDNSGGKKSELTVLVNFFVDFGGERLIKASPEMELPVGDLRTEFQNKLGGSVQDCGLLKALLFCVSRVNKFSV